MAADVVWRWWLEERQLVLACWLVKSTAVCQSVDSSSQIEDFQTGLRLLTCAKNLGWLRCISFQLLLAAVAMEMSGPNELCKSVCGWCFIVLPALNVAKKLYSLVSNVMYFGCMLISVLSVSVVALEMSCAEAAETLSPWAWYLKPDDLLSPLQLICDFRNPNLSCVLL